MAQTDITVDELVKKIERGEIRLPEMQRQYVWQKTRVRDLLDSLYRKYPSGMILTWETSDGDKVSTRDFSVGQETSKRQNFELLLDGQQRLTSLSAILRGEHVHVRGRKKPIDILFNLEHPENLEEVTEVYENEETENDTNTDADANADTETDTDPDESTADASEDELRERFDRMAFVVHTKKLAQLPHWVSVTEVFKESNDAPFLEKAGIDSFKDPRYDKYTKRLKRLRDIKDYPYRVQILEQDKSYEEVTEIFVRVNSLGVKLRGSDLALAQITAKWPGSLEIFQEFDRECSGRGFDLGLAIHLKNLVAFATGHSHFKTVGSLEQSKLESSWKDAKEGMRFALNFLSSNAGIDSPALLSSPFLVITLAAYGHSKNYELRREEETRLRYWVLVANTKARYSRGSSETFLDQDLRNLNEGIGELLRELKTQVGRLEVSSDDLENRTNRSAYFKAMFMAFKEKDARDWRDQLVISLKHSGTQHALQFHHVFPQAVLKRKGLSSQKINDMCNLVFISGQTNRRISDKEPAVYLPDVVKAIGPDGLSRQCIPDDSDLWKVDAYDEFLEKRRELVAYRLNEFLGHSQMGAAP